MRSAEFVSDGSGSEYSASRRLDATIDEVVHFCVQAAFDLGLVLKERQRREVGRAAAPVSRAPSLGVLSGQPRCLAVQGAGSNWDLGHRVMC